MTRFLQFVVVAGAAIVGLVVGTVVGGFMTPPGSGLAGPAIAFGYGVIGAIGLSVVALLALTRLEGRGLRIAAVVSAHAGIPLLVFIGLGYHQSIQANVDPEQAYATLPSFTIDLQQIRITDPYLSTQTEIDTDQRRWQITLPDRRKCTGNLRAAAQARVAGALRGFLDELPTASQACPPGDSAADQRLSWSLRSSAATRGQLMISASCLKKVPKLRTLLHEVRLVHQREPSNVDCDS